MAQNSCSLSLPSFFIYLKQKWVARVMGNEIWAWSKQETRKTSSVGEYSVSSRRRDVFDNKLTVPKEKKNRERKKKLILCLARLS